MEKYYTPDIEEFHVGFECELRNSSSEPFEWEPFKIIGVDDGEISGRRMDWSFYDSNNSIRDEMVRVKYLEWKDIEELGFEHLGSGWFERKNSYHRYESGIHDCRIRMWKDNQLDIWAYWKDDEPSIIFTGELKNKSELVKILQQLGIRIKGNEE